MFKSVGRLVYLKPSIREQRVHGRQSIVDPVGASLNHTREGAHRAFSYYGAPEGEQNVTGSLVILLINLLRVKSHEAG